MGPTVTFLLSIGLCLNWGIGAQMGSLPRPTLWADPSPVAPKGSNVTLRCQGRHGAHRFQLWKDGELREERRESEHLGEFALRDMDVERDAWSYSCRYGQGSLWSELSEPLALVVMTGELPPPSIAISPSSPIQAGTPATVYCQRSEAEFSQEYTFVLLEAQSLEPLRGQSTVLIRSEFSLLQVRAEDSGSYSCVYYNKKAPFRGSLPSQSLLLTVRGLLPKPTLRPHPGLLVVPGTNITFWCWRPKMPSLKEVEFTLSKTGMEEPLQIQRSAEPWTGFLLPSVGPEDTGNYSCAYRDSRDPARHSESSDALELLVTGSHPKPSLSALPDVVVKPGTHVTLKCWQHPQLSTLRVTFILLKVGTPQPLQTQSPAGTTADFPLLSVRAEDAGNYSCVYHSRIHPYQVSEPSEVLEIWVTDKGPSNTDVNGYVSAQSHSTTLLLLLCASFILLLCLLLLMLLCHCCRHMRSPQRANSRRCLCYSCLPGGDDMPPNTDAPREETLYTEMAKERPREASVSMAEEPQGVTYAQLNAKALNKRNREHMRPCTEPTLYASVSTE